ncbi:MAG: flagellar hook assembly protein FlgD [Myxococcales bacterium]|nr:flagellar hook assembly protein FlgD [Myxococcales bacterium]
MAINPITGAVNTQTLAPRKESGPASGALDRDAFMQLLVAELRNQDPLNPMESREMVSQLSELTGVEKLTEIGQSLQILGAETAGIASMQTASLVGKTVTASGKSLYLDPIGPAETSFTLNGRAEGVTVSIRNAAGREVRTLELGDTYPGTHGIFWDGNEGDGNRADPGLYSIDVTAVDAAGLPVATSSEVVGVVNSVSYDNGYPELQIGSSSIPLSNIISIAE